MGLEIMGVIVHIEPTVQVNDRFKKREFVLEITEQINGNNYTNYAKLQTVQAKCDLLDRYGVGEQVTVSFNVKGNKWEKDGKVQYITNLDAWKIASTAGNVPDYTNVAKDNTPGLVSNTTQSIPSVPNGQSQEGSENHDLPF